MTTETPHFFRFVVDFVDAVTTRPMLEDLARSSRTRRPAAASDSDVFPIAADWNQLDAA